MESPNPSSATVDPELVSKETFDYIIIGAGVAGTTLAARLSEDETKSVLLLEAGEDVSEMQVVKIPGEQDSGGDILSRQIKILLGCITRNEIEQPPCH